MCLDLWLTGGLPCLTSTLFALNVGASKGTLTFMDYGWSCCWIHFCPPWSITNKESWNRIQMHQVLPTFAHSFRVQEQRSERLMKVYGVVGLLLMNIWIKLSVKQWTSENCFWMIHVFCSRTFSQFRICRVLLEDIAASTRGRCHVFLNDKELTVQFRGGFGGCVNGTRLFQHFCLPICSNATFLTDGF